MEEKETNLKRRQEWEKETRQNEFEVQKVWLEGIIKNYNFNKYFCLARSPIQCYAFPSVE